ncbi:hypothetical protein [Amycolatopsis nalaikhensis]|uniref:Integral membrane protein n=1 Tax=Amycolatopsis nalaikhensis TaxID=715472 RepID=A0ABY8XZW6_9PSEU|nr:hypothetical protein [Amycolatopsis sp. 2-2]WIV61127.1 hypothetical protein QP939_22255 [Amycolatopsis sp. 2-2]
MRHRRPDDRRPPWGVRRTVLSAAAAVVLLLGWFALAVRLALPSAEPVGFLPFVLIAFAALVVVGRRLARTGLLLALLGLLPVLAAVLGGWTAVGDEILRSRGKPVEVLVTAESAVRLRGGFAYTYDVRKPDGSPDSLDPGTGTRLVVGSRVRIVEDPGGLVATQLAGKQDPAVPLVFAGLGVGGLVGSVAVTAVAGERRRVRNATTR